MAVLEWSNGKQSVTASASALVAVAGRRQSAPHDGHGRLFVHVLLAALLRLAPAAPARRGAEPTFSQRLPSSLSRLFKRNYLH